MAREHDVVVIRHQMREIELLRDAMRSYWMTYRGKADAVRVKLKLLSADPLASPKAIEALARDYKQLCDRRDHAESSYHGFRIVSGDTVRE